jgi:hypothetical protein
MKIIIIINIIFLYYFIIIIFDIFVFFEDIFIINYYLTNRNIINTILKMKRNDAYINKFLLCLTYFFLL